MRPVFPRHILVAPLAIGAIALAGASITACGGGDDNPANSGDTATQAQSTPSGDGSGSGDNRRTSTPEFSGDLPQARAGAESIDEVYQSFGAAVEAGIASTDIAARTTLENADDNESLTKVCNLMSSEAKRQTISYTETSAGFGDVEWTCEKAIGLLLRRARQAGGLKRTLSAEVVGVNVKGDRATASIRFGGKGPIASVPLVKEDGKWKLAGSPGGVSGGQ